jgi:uncharacterized membrane protein YkvA (DUF1232 family)
MSRCRVENLLTTIYSKHTSNRVANKTTKTENQRPIKKTMSKKKVELKSRMKGFLMFLPNLLRLCANLLKDSRVPTTEKALFVGAIIYAIAPLDFIPDFLPFIGQVDDIYLIALTLLRLVNRTDEMVVRENWRGGGDIVALADAIAGLVPRLLPKRIHRVISSRVEVTPKIGDLIKAGKDRKPILVEINEEERKEIPRIDERRMKMKR